MTLDLSLFPDFHQEMLGYISSGNPVCTEIAEGDYIIEIDEAKFRKQVIDSIGEQYHQEYLEDCIRRQQEKLAENGPTQTIAVDEDETAQEPVSNSNIEEKAVREGLRDYNLAFRKYIRKIIQTIQQKRQEDLEVELGISSFPPSSFNPKHEEQKLYDGLQRIAHSATKEEYLTKAVELIEEVDLDLVMYDLFLILRRFENQIGINSLYLYFNEISNDEYSFPLFCLETDMTIDEKRLKLSSVRDVVMLNTPAVNFFESERVATQDLDSGRGFEEQNTDAVKKDKIDLEQYSEFAGKLPPEADEFRNMTDELLTVYDPKIPIHKITDEKIDLADAPASVAKTGATTYSELEYGKRPWNC